MREGLLPCLLGLALSACGPSEIPDQRRLFLESWGKATLLADYREFELASAELEAQTGALCESPSELALNEAQDAWWRARAPWKRAEVFGFGPYQDSPWRLGSQIDFWPARTTSIEGVLSGTAPLTADSLELLGAAQKGLPAIEYLLYQPDVDLVASFSEVPRRCEYLTLIATGLTGSAAAMVAAWDPERGNYLAELVNAGRGSSAYASLHAAVGEVVNRMGFAVEAIRSNKLGKPLGTGNGGSPEPDLTESRFSGRSLEDIRDNLRSIELSFYGDEARGALGLDSYLRKKGRYFAPRMSAGLEASRAALDAISVPLSQAVSEQRQAVESASTALGALQRLIQVDIIGALSLTVTFSDNDGD
jgi:predicted lipoprotein